MAWMTRLITGVMLVGLLTGVAGCDKPRNHLDRVIKSGELVVATRNTPTTYYEGPLGPTGFEYDLARRFADELGVKLKIVTPSNLSDILALVNRGEVDFAAAGLTVTKSRKHWVRFTPPYHEITQQLVYRMGESRKPREIADLVGRHIEVIAESSHVEQLEALQAAYPDLDWVENPELESDELLYLVWQQVVDYTIADSNEVALNRRFYPELSVAFDMSAPQELAWAFSRQEDSSLYTVASAFIDRMRESGELKILQERYYGHVERFDYVGTRTYMKHILTRLPEYRENFELAAKQHDVDWRLLAAIGYQESHWNPKARSPTGVRGLMMLTTNTAEHIGIDNRLDPEQSIEGGAKYISMMVDKIPKDIPKPDRTWMGLAAYNVGYGHLEDARVITEIRGGDPDSWKDVKKNLPLLSRKDWYQKTKHGYARGREPVKYVENIRSYYDILVWYSEQNNPPVTVESANILELDTPAL
jgi:membrane-bound lytic murein transglycosylase F